MTAVHRPATGVSAARSAPDLSQAASDRDDEELVLHAVLRPVGHRDLAAAAVQRISQVITLGIVTAGRRLPPERQLAAWLGVARMTLRHALHTLTERGYVTARRGPRGGTFVTYQPDAHATAPPRHHGTPAPDLDDVLTLHGIVEPGVAEVAARHHLDPAERAWLHQRLRDTTAATSPVEHQLADARLHLAIAELTRSPSAIAAVADVHTTLAEPLTTLPESAWHQAADDHRALVDAIVAGRPATARQRMDHHVTATGAALRTITEQPPALTVPHGTCTEVRARP